MTLESLIEALPKVDLGLQFEGAIPKQTLLMIAEQNEFAAVKGFANQAKALDAPDYHKLHDLLNTVTQWIRHPDDLSRAVYDVGVSLAKQNVRYAEISISPITYMANGWTFEQFAEALNDGRDRAQRGWKVRLAWVLAIPREEPRRSDEITRWAMSATGRKNGVVALGLVGREDLQPVGQFERAFRSAEKKEFPRVAQAGGSKLGLNGLVEAVRVLKPDRLLCGETLPAAAELIAALQETGAVLDVVPKQALLFGQIHNYADYPLRGLLEAGVPVTISSRMPALFRTTLNKEYLALVEQGILTLDELEAIALNAVRHSLLPTEERSAMLAEFEARYAELRAEHLIQHSAE